MPVGETDVKVLSIGNCTDMVQIYGTEMEKSTSFPATMSGTLMLTRDSGEDLVITAPPSVLAQYLHSLDQKQFTDVQAVEEHLIDSGSFAIELNEASVTSKLTLSTNQEALASASNDTLAEDILGTDMFFDST
ncbi:unnamed protein product [Lota lota]